MANSGSPIFESLRDSGIPDEWPIVPFEDVVFFQEGPGIRNWQYVYEGGIPFVNIRCLINGRLDRGSMNRVSEEEAFGKYSHFQLDVNDFVVSSSGTLGRLATVTPEDLPCILNTSVIRMRPRDGRLDRDYLKFFILSDYYQTQIRSLATGSVQLNYGPSHLRQMFIVLPPLPVQQRIADVLGKLDNKIELNRRMNRTLEKMAAALFKSWFIDFDPVHAKAESRDPNLPAEIADLFPDGFEESDLGPIPKGWTVAPMKDLAVVNARSIKKDYPHTRIRYVDISSVSQGNLDQTTTYDLADAPSRAKRMVQTGDTIWSCVRPNRKAYLYIDRPADNLVVSTGFAVLSPRAVPASYLHQCVTTQVFVDYLTAYATGAAYPAVKVDTFKTAKMILPSKSILEAFHDLVGPLRARSAHNQRQNRRLACLRDTLLPKLLSGEIEVHEAEGMVEEVV